MIWHRVVTGKSMIRHIQDAMASLQRVKKWSTRLIVASFFLVGGIEYSVILPTMWDYLHSKGGEEWLYGVSLAAFSISNLITGPLYGIVFDRTHKTKLIVLFANLFEIGGNFMYFAATSKYMIMGSRFVVGLGAGAGAALFAELARTSRKKELTLIFSIFSSMRQLGLIIGPAFNLFTRKMNFKMGPFAVMKYTAPGLLMTFIWVIVEILFILMFYHLPPIKEELTVDEQRSPKHKNKAQVNQLHNAGPPISAANIQVEGNIPDESLGDVTKSTKDMFKYSQSVQAQDGGAQSENSPLLPHFAVTKSPPYYNSNSNNPNPHEAAAAGQGNDETSFCQRIRSALRHLVWMISELLREEMIVLLAILFITMFSQTTTEAMLVPMTEKLLGWDEFENSIFFCVAGAEIILAFLLVGILSRFVGDRWQTLAGLLINVTGYAWIMGFTAGATKDTPGELWKFIVGSIIMILGLPIFGVTGASLYSKLLPPSIQGFGQGIRRSVFSTAAILGPLWAGGTVSLSYYVLLGVPCGLLLFVTLLLLLSFTKLKESKSPLTPPTSPKLTTNSA